MATTRGAQALTGDLEAHKLFDWGETRPQSNQARFFGPADPLPQGPWRPQAATACLKVPCLVFHTLPRARPSLSLRIVTRPPPPPLGWQWKHDGLARRLSCRIFLMRYVHVSLCDLTFHNGRPCPLQSPEKTRPAGPRLQRYMTSNEGKIHRCSSHDT